MRVVVQPFGGVLVSTHALHPTVGIARHDGGKDIVRRQVGHVLVGAMDPSKGLVAHGGVFAPQDLPSNAPLVGPELFHARRHVTIGQQHFRQQIGARVKGAGRTQKVAGRNARPLKAGATLESVVHGLGAVQ